MFWVEMLERPWEFPPGNRRSADEDSWDHGASRLERPWDHGRIRGGSRGTVEGMPWKQVRGSSLGNRTDAEGTGEQREKAAGEHKEIKSKQFRI